MNTGFSILLRVNNPADFRFRWSTKAKSATSCGNAFVTNILLASAGGAMNHHRPFGYACDGSPVSLISPESPPFTSINVMSITPLGDKLFFITSFNFT